MQGLLYAEFFLECLLLLIHIPADVAGMSTASSKSIPTEKMQLMQFIAEEENSQVQSMLPLYDWARS